MIHPPTRPPVNNQPAKGDVRCVWGACEAGGWILARAVATGRVERDEVGQAFHPGCRAAMVFAKNLGRATDPAHPDLCRAPGTVPNRCAYATGDGDTCPARCLYVVNGKR